MATVTGKMILDRALRELYDEDETRWNRDELLRFLSDGQREAVSIRPAAHSVNESVECVKGTRQSIPPTGLTLIDVIRVMGEDGETPGRVVRQTDRHFLDGNRPDWHTEDPSIETRSWMWDDRDPAHFYVSPPQPAVPGYLEIVYAATPAELTDESATIDLDDAYATALMYYVMARALAKNGGQQDPAKSGTYYEMFRSLMEGREMAANRLHPDQMPERARK